MKAARSLPPPPPVDVEPTTTDTLPPASGVVGTKSTVATAAHMPTAEEVQQYMPLVHQTVARFLRKLPPNVLRDDLVAAGMFGLVDSLRKNGVERGPTFEWYARIRIRGAIVDELRAQDWLTRRARGHASARAASAGDQGGSRASVVGFDDLAGGLGAVCLADEESPSPLDAVEEQLDREALAAAIARLPERERTIVQAHYFEGVQFKAIAAALGVSEPRVSQLHTRAVQLLRTLLEDRVRAA